MFKKILIVSLFASLLVGCTTTEEQEFHESNNDSAIIFSTNFNQEHYIWENWSFSTNRVNQK